MAFTIAADVGSMVYWGAVINSMILLIKQCSSLLNQSPLPLGEYSDCRTYFQPVAALSMLGILATLPPQQNGGIFDQV